MHNDPRSDETLIALLVTRDPNASAALGELYQRHANPTATMLCWVHGLSHDDAYDVVEDAFVSVIRRAHQFKPQTSTFKSWFARIAINQSIDAYRRRSRWRECGCLEDEEYHLTAPRSTPTEREIDVRRGLACLSADECTLLVLKYYRDFTEREIAEAQNIPLGTVAGRLRQARQRLRQHLEATGERQPALRHP